MPSHAHGGYFSERVLGHKASPSLYRQGCSEVGHLLRMQELPRKLCDCVHLYLQGQLFLGCRQLLQGSLASRCELNSSIGVIPRLVKRRLGKYIYIADVLMAEVRLCSLSYKQNSGNAIMVLATSRRCSKRSDPLAKLKSIRA